MEQINKRLTDKQKDFLNSLSIYIKQPIYFYGSICRVDYFSGKSDIDIIIFTDNEISTIQMLCNFLNISKNDFEKEFLKTELFVVTGYGVRYQDECNDINIEISIYNNKDKTIVLAEHNRNIRLPIYISIMLMIVKFCYYKLDIISSYMYAHVKRVIMNPEMEFNVITIDS